MKLPEEMGCGDSQLCEVAARAENSGKLDPKTEGGWLLRSKECGNTDCALNFQGRRQRSDADRHAVQAIAIAKQREEVACFGENWEAAGR